MSLTKDDLKQIKEIVTESESRIKDDLRGEMKALNDAQSKKLRGEFKDDMKSLEYTLREEIQYNRREIQSVRKRVEDLSKEIEDVNENRTEDIDLAFSDIAKNSADIQDHDGRILRLENQAA